MQVKKTNNNLFVAIATVLVVIGLGAVVSGINNLTAPQANKSPLISLDIPTASVEANLSDKTISSVTLNPITPTDIPPIAPVKKVKVLRLDPDRTINVFGPIGNNAHQAAAAIRSMNTMSKSPIYVVLYSPGGSVIDGAALISTMQASDAPVHTICYSFCASMAAMIHQYGIQRYMTDRSILMFHPASFGTQGEVDKVFSQTQTIQRYINKIEIEVANKMKISFDEYKKRASKEYWIDSEDSLKANVVDSIIYMAPSSSFRMFSREIEESKKQFIYKIDNLQWIY